MGNKIELIGTLSFEELANLLKTVPVLGDTGRIKDILGFPDQPEKWRRPYSKATIELKTFGNGCELNRSNVFPLAYYVLHGGLKRIREDRTSLLDGFGIDIFDFNKDVCAVRYTDGNKTFLMTPPLIEFSERDGVNLVIDGLHRILVAESSNLPIKVLHVTDVPNRETEMPVVAFPIDWSKVVPKDEDAEPKRNYGHTTKPETYGGHPYSFFRDLSGLNIGGVRSAEKHGVNYNSNPLLVDNPRVRGIENR